MLALLYLGLAIYLGDQISRRVFRFVTVAQRCATAVLVGLLLSSWFTYATAWLFRATTIPLFWGDLCFFAVAAAVIWRSYRRGPGPEPDFISPRVPGSAFWDWVTIAAFFVFACWMMFATLSYKDGTLLIGNNEWSDFGPNTAIIQSFAVGHNFPTHYPHFSGEPIRYHFLFYFQAGNLTFLGLPLAWSLNFLSIITLVSLLALLMALGQLLFQSRTVGRIGAALFFFHGTLSFVSFFRAQPSISAAFHTILGLKDFLASGYPYRGETWGIWTQVVYLNQRHFASAVGLLVVVLLFLIDRYRQHSEAKAVLPAVEPPPAPELSPAAEPEFPEPDFSIPSSPPIEAPKPEIRFSDRLRQLPGKLVVFDKSFLFAGFLLGLLPFWNALVFTAAFAILSLLFLFFPCRRQMVGLGLVAALVALPQLALLKAGGAHGATHSLLHWGYVIGPPTMNNILRYIAFSFGLKWALVLVALIFANWFERRFFLALCVMYVMTFCLQMSIEALANHKYLNTWLIISNLFAAYGVWRLCRLRVPWLRILSGGIALLVTGAIVLGGAIDLVPIHNCYWIQMKYERDPLVTWLREYTKPHDIFLSDRFVNHAILLAGRRLFYGWPSFPWSSGYDTTQRDRDYRELFESTDPYAVFRLLYKHKIAYVAIDDSIRHNHEFIKRPNEELYKLNFPKVWEDTSNQYGKLTIYRVPHPPPANLKRPDPGHLQAMLLNIPPVTMFQGGKGPARGQFDSPRGLTIDPAGNILISDSENSRIQRFSPTGAFLNIIGQPGTGAQTLKSPDGIAVDKSGFIYVADGVNHNVQKLAPNGYTVATWKGPEPGFYGPRDIAIGPGNSIYVVDQGRTRIVRIRSDGTILQVWGSPGKGDGQFSDPSSVAVDERNNRIYVADPGNQRIQVFDLDGKFIMKWPVEEWPRSSWAVQHLAIDPQAGRLYATSFTTSEVLVFDLTGKKLKSLTPKDPDKLEGASAIGLSHGKLYVLNTLGNRVSVIDLHGQP